MFVITPGLKITNHVKQQNSYPHIHHIDRTYVLNAVDSDWFGSEFQGDTSGELVNGRRGHTVSHSVGELKEKFQG